MFQLCSATNAKLDALAALVKEGKSLDEANDFARFVLNSRLADLLDEHSSKGSLPCSGKLIRRKASKLREACCGRWAGRDAKPHVETSDLVEIRAELASLRAQLFPQAVPVLKVLPGGAS